MNKYIARLGTAAALALGLSYMLLLPAQAQESVVKQCGDKWAAAKTAGTTDGLSWPKFLSQCRTDLAAGTPAVTPAAVQAPVAAQAPAVAPAPATQPAPIPAATPAARTTRTTQPATAPAAAGSPVFPTAIAPQFASETAGKARMDTCLAQYNANKKTNGNGGLTWIVKGGGYYSQCNKLLKG